MSEAKHTPGTWVVGVSVDNTCEEPWPVFRLRDLADPNPSGDEVQANRCLIAAAPDLLEACKAVVKVPPSQMGMDMVTAAHKCLEAIRKSEQQPEE